MPPLAISFSNKHPAFVGHFPENPIVPGVMILDLVLEHLNQKFPDKKPSGFSHVKFLRPLIPEQIIYVTFTSISEQKVSFKCSEEMDIYVKGEIEIQ